jgi:site-specific DNA-methyltransferase (adenine-specific)
MSPHKRRRHVIRSVPLGRGELRKGDCLQVLTEPNAPQGFDLAYMDPPFNAGGERGARQKQGERVAGQVAYRDAWGGLDSFLTMLEPRLVAVREALSSVGSLWLHLDHRAVHDAKVLADRVFGRSAFQGEVIWVPGNGGKRRSGPSVTHQTILIFARGREMIWNGEDPALRERHAATSLRMHFKNVDADGRNYRDRHVAGKTYRYYADLGRRIGSVWSDCPSMRANTPLIQEATGYPTQKPESLLERILRASTLPQSRVLDPMHGSGTTLAVAERLSRTWLGIDESPLAHRIAKARLKALCGAGAPEPKARAARAR